MSSNAFRGRILGGIDGTGQEGHVHENYRKHRLLNINLFEEVVLTMFHRACLGRYSFLTEFFATTLSGHCVGAAHLTSSNVLRGTVRIEGRALLSKSGALDELDDG